VFFVVSQLAVCRQFSPPLVHRGRLSSSCLVFLPGVTVPAYTLPSLTLLNRVTPDRPSDCDIACCWTELVQTPSIALKIIIPWVLPFYSVSWPHCRPVSHCRRTVS